MSRAVNASDGYLEAMVKNMPSETVAGYLAVLGLMSGKADSGESVWIVIVWIVWAVFLIATPLYLWLVKPKNDQTPRPWWQVWIFAPIAFIVWSMTTGGPWAGIEQAPMIGSILILLLSVVVFPLVSMAIAKATS